MFQFPILYHKDLLNNGIEFIQAWKLIIWLLTVFWIRGVQYKNAWFSLRQKQKNEAYCLCGKKLLPWVNSHTGGWNIEFCSRQPDMQRKSLLNLWQTGLLRMPVNVIRRNMNSWYYSGCREFFLQFYPQVKIPAIFKISHVGSKAAAYRISVEIKSGVMMTFPFFAFLKDFDATVFL